MTTSRSGLSLDSTQTRPAQVGRERIRPATDHRSPWVELDQILINDRSVQLKLMNNGDEWRRMKRRQIWLEESETSPI